jgi:heme exporter protein C
VNAPNEPARRWELAVAAVGVALLAYGSWRGLFVAPPDRFMGDVMRIMYVHVPTAWSTLLCFTFAFVCSIASLWTRRWHWDGLLESSAEVGVVLGALLLAQGSIWARPTWGVWWDWDPRLTTTAVMVLAYLGILALRGFVDDARQRATWSAVATIVAFVDVPIVYFSVRWWRSLHQVQSSPETVDSAMVTPLRINAFALLFLAIAFVVLRYRVWVAKMRAELAGEAA